MSHHFVFGLTQFWNSKTCPSFPSVGKPQLCLRDGVLQTRLSSGLRALIPLGILPKDFPFSIRSAHTLQFPTLQPHPWIISLNTDASFFFLSLSWLAGRPNRDSLCVHFHLFQLGAAVSTTRHIKLYDQMDQSISPVYVTDRPGNIPLYRTLSGSGTAPRTLFQLVHGI